MAISAQGAIAVAAVGIQLFAERQARARQRTERCPQVGQRCEGFIGGHARECGWICG